jgi:DNA gyrase/topoisomerase IV subunit A
VLDLTEQLEAATAENAKLQSETSRNDDEIALLKKQLATCTEQNAHLHDELKESKLRFVKLYNKLCCQIRTDEPEADQLIEESDAAVAASSSESNSRSADDAVQSQSAGLRNIEQDIIYLSDDDDDYVPSVKSSNRKASENYEIGKLDVFDLVEKAKLIIKRLRLRHIDLAKQLGLPRQLLSSLLQQPQKLSSLSKARLSGYQKLQVWCVKNDKRSSIG